MQLIYERVASTAAYKNVSVVCGKSTLDENIVADN